MNEVIKCECGLTYVPGIEKDDTYHFEHHDKWVNGQPISVSPYERVIGNIDGRNVLESSMAIPQSYRRELAEVARLAHYDMADYPIGYDGSDDTEFESRAYILMERDRGVGLIIIWRGNRFWPFVWDNGKEILLSQSATEAERWAIARIWIVSKLRKRGFAKQLLNMVAGHLSTELCELGWELPFTDTGRYLVKSVCPKGFLGSEDVFFISDYNCRIKP
jgi:GNAT superfamily N-acetyltransferase